MSEELIVIPCDPNQVGRVRNPRTRNCVLQGDRNLVNAIKSGQFKLDRKQLSSAVLNFYDSKMRVIQSQPVVVVPKVQEKLVSERIVVPSVSDGYIRAKPEDVATPYPGKPDYFIDPKFLEPIHKDSATMSALLAMENGNRRRAAFPSPAEYALKKYSSVPLKPSSKVQSCSPGQIKNPRTGVCVLKVTAQDVAQPCGPGKVINPRTQNCVKEDNINIKKLIKIKQQKIFDNLIYQRV